MKTFRFFEGGSVMIDLEKCPGCLRCLNFKNTKFLILREKQMQSVNVHYVSLNGFVLLRYITKYMDHTIFPMDVFFTNGESKRVSEEEFVNIIEELKEKCNV